MSTGYSATKLMGKYDTLIGQQQQSNVVGKRCVCRELADSGTDLPAGLLIRADPAVLVDS